MTASSRRPRAVTRDARLAQMEREALLAAVEADFRQHGAATIERLRVERPADYLRLVAVLNPTEIKPMVDGRRAMHEFTDDELRAIVWQGLAEQGIGPERLAEIKDKWAALLHDGS